MKSSTNFCCLRALDVVVVNWNFFTALLLFVSLLAIFLDRSIENWSFVSNFVHGRSRRKFFTDHLQRVRDLSECDRNRTDSIPRMQKSEICARRFYNFEFFFSSLLGFCCRRSFLCLNYSFSFTFRCWRFVLISTTFREGFRWRKIHVTWFNLSSLRHRRSVLDWVVEVGSGWWNSNRVCTLSGAVETRRMLTLLSDITHKPRHPTMEARRRRKKRHTKEKFVIE